MTPVAVSYATAQPDAVATLLRERYALPEPLACTLLNRGFNDMYAITAGAGERFVFRVSGHRARGPADVAAETEFLAHLDAAGVPVAAAVPTRHRALFTSVALPQGARAAVLFRHADGRKPELDEPEDARAQGATLARLHSAATDFAGRESGRYRLDLDHLLHRPLAADLALDLETPSGLLPLAHRLAARIAQMEPHLTRTRCHGDCHGLNARISPAGRAVFFDFDDGGFGFLAYDLAVHLWAQTSFGRWRTPMWHAFMAGYSAVRPVSPADEAAVRLFVPIRHIWLMGEWASRTAEWGHEVLTTAWLARETAFLLDWEQNRLAPQLWSW